LDNDVSADYKLKLKRAAVDVKRLDDGTLILRSPYAAETPVSNPNVWLRKWAGETPAQVFVAERDSGGDWRQLTYGEALKTAETIASKLVKMGLSQARPLAILAVNGIDHALMRLAAMLAGIPVLGIDPLASEAGNSAQFLTEVLELIQPGMLYADDCVRHGAALAMAQKTGCEILWSLGPESAAPGFAKFAKRGMFSGGFKGPEPDGAATATIGLTRGEDGVLRAVYASFADLCREQAAIAAIAPHLDIEHPVIVDAGAWHRREAGNLIFFTALRRGGTICVDEFLAYDPNKGAALPAPTVHFADAKNLYAVLAHFELDNPACRLFFQKLNAIWIYGGTLPEAIAEKLMRMSVKEAGYKLAIFNGCQGENSMVTGLACWFETESDQNIGLPLPGRFLRLAPIDRVSDGEAETYQLHIMPFFDENDPPDPDDAENYFDAYVRVQLIDPMRPYLGIERVPDETQ